MASDLVAAARPPLVECCQDGGRARVGVVRQGRRDVDDVATAPCEHLGDGALGEQEEPSEVDADRGCVVVAGVVGERLGDKDSGVVDEGVDSPEALHGPSDDALDGLRVGDVSVDGQDRRVLGRPDRSGAGHDRPAPRRYSATTPAPMPREPPVTMTTLWTRWLIPRRPSRDPPRTGVSGCLGLGDLRRLPELEAVAFGIKGMTEPPVARLRDLVLDGCSSRT